MISRKFHQAHCGQKKCFLTISREAGAGGSEIAAIVGKRLGWEVLDKNLLDQVAERFHIDRTMLNLVDETRSNWVYDVLGTWMDSKVIPHETYVSQLSRIIQAAAHQSKLYFRGTRGQISFAARKDFGRTVDCLGRISDKADHAIPTNSVRWMLVGYMHEIDQGRREFVQRFFHHDITDPHLYDLVINTERFGIEGTAEEIITAMSLAKMTAIVM